MTRSEPSLSGLALPKPREECRTVLGLRTFARAVGAGRDVVLVHGAGVSAEYWRPAQAALARTAGFRVHALDLPGFGRSEKPDRFLTLPRLSRHLLAWLDAAGVAECALVGQSVGCEIALRCAVAAPGVVRRLVLAAPAGLPRLRSLSRQLLLALLDAPLEPWSVYRAILPAYMRCGPGRLLRILREQTRRGSGRLLHRVRQPTLVLRGERDVLVPDGRVRAVAAALRDARLAAIPGAHAAHCSHPDDFAAAVAGFLKAGWTGDQEDSSRQ